MTIECRIVNKIWRHCPISFNQVSLWCLLLVPYPTTHHSIVGLHKRSNRITPAHLKVQHKVPMWLPFWLDIYKWMVFASLEVVGKWAIVLIALKNNIILSSLLRVSNSWARFVVKNKHYKQLYYNEFGLCA